MKYIVLIVLLAVCGWSKGQSSDNRFLVNGTINYPTYCSSSLSPSCFVSPEKLFDAHTKVFISGIKECKIGDGYSKRFFEFIVDNKNYLIESRLVTTTNKNKWDIISLMTPEEIDSLKFTASKAWKENLEADLKERSEELRVKKLDTLAVGNFLEKTKPQGLTVLKFSCYDESEYTKGTGVKVRIYNPSKKTIKYVWFSFSGYNTVGDRVSSRGKSLITTRGIGPIRPDEEGSYEYEYVWFTDIVESVKLTFIKLQYMDGTFKLIANPMAITLPSKLYEIVDEED